MSSSLLSAASMGSAGRNFAKETSGSRQPTSRTAQRVPYSETRDNGIPEARHRQFALLSYCVLSGVNTAAVIAKRWRLLVPPEHVERCCFAVGRACVARPRRRRGGQGAHFCLDHPAVGAASLQGDRATAEPFPSPTRNRTSLSDAPPEGGPGSGGARVPGSGTAAICRWAGSHCRS